MVSLVLAPAVVLEEVVKVDTPATNDERIASIVPILSGRRDISSNQYKFGPRKFKVV